MPEVRAVDIVSQSLPRQCTCGHPLDDHEHVPGVQFSDPKVSGTVVTDEAGNVLTGLPDVWICTGTRLVDVNDPDVSPWDAVCGCVLHQDPSPPKPGLRAAA